MVRSHRDPRAAAPRRRRRAANPLQRNSSWLVHARATPREVVLSRWPVTVGLRLRLDAYGRARPGPRPAGGELFSAALALVRQTRHAPRCTLQLSDEHGLLSARFRDHAPGGGPATH